MSRRGMLKGVMVGMAGVLVGCPPAAEQRELPEPYEGSLEGEGPVPPMASKTIVLPPVTPPQKTEYGDIMPRRSWTGASADLARGRPMGGVQRITVHHSGDGKPFVATSVVETIRHLQMVRQAHLQRGMIDIAYHFAVDRAGRVWQLRSLRYEGQHVRPSKDRRIFWNEHNIGIVVLGDFDLQMPTQAQVDRLMAFVHLVRGKYALAVDRVYVHGELVQTDCPGRHLGPAVKAARVRGAV